MSKPQGESRFLPGFAIAPGSNRAMVRNPELLDRCPILVDTPPRPAKNQEELLAALEALQQKHAFASVLEASGLHRHTVMELPPPSSWNDLRASSAEWLKRHIFSMPVHDQEAARSIMKATYQVAEEGSATSVAFIEIVAPTLADREFADPNAEIAGWARRSKGLVVAWAGVDHLVDPMLAYALALPDASGVKRKANLHFDPSWFVATDKGEIHLDAAKVPDLRGQGGYPPQSYQDAARALFACPAMAFIPAMYDAQVAAAEQAGLFGQSYEQARANS